MGKSNADLIWANEMLEVWQNRGIDSIDCQWSTPSAEAMARWIRADDKNETKFIADLVPKATGILAKHGMGDVADAVMEIDVKTIRDLQGLLTDALKKSKDGPHSEQAPEPEPVYVDPGGVGDACGSLEDALAGGDLPSYVIEDDTEPPMQHFANGTPAFLGFKPEPTGKIDDTELEPEPGFETDLSLEDLF